MPHGMCYLWQPGTLWLNVASDALIAAAYYTIPFALYYLVHERRKEIPYPGIILMFAAFIILCGTTHPMEIWTVWHPEYRLAGAIKGVTGIVSVATTFALFKLIPQAMQLRSPPLSCNRKWVLERRSSLISMNSCAPRSMPAIERKPNYEIAISVRTSSLRRLRMSFGILWRRFGTRLRFSARPRPLLNSSAGVGRSSIDRLIVWRCCSMTCWRSLASRAARSS